MHPILEAPLRAVAAYIWLLVLARFMGRKMISQMTFFDFAVGITVGSVTASMALGAKSTLLTSAIVLGILALLTVAVDFTQIKSLLFTKLVNSEPLVLVAQGKMVYQNLRRARLPVTELLMLLREKNYFYMSDVDYAIMETDGKLSVLPKPGSHPATPSDLGFSPQPRGLDINLVIDGQIMEENLVRANMSKEKLLTRLQDQGVSNVGEILFASQDSANNFHISLKKEEREPHGKYGIE